MLQAKLVFATLIVCIAGMPVDSWSCGGDAECRCSAKKLITCDAINQAPRFTTRNKLGKTIVLNVANPEWFILDTLERTYGYEHVLLTGGDLELCQAVSIEFEWITCIVEQTTTQACVGPDCRIIQSTVVTADHVMTTETDFPETTGYEQTTDTSAPRAEKITKQSTTIGLTFDYVTKKLQETTIVSTGPEQSTEHAKSWTVSELTFWGTVAGGSSGGVVLMVIILIIVIGRCTGRKQDPAWLVKLCKTCCDCCLCPVNYIGEMRNGNIYSKDELECSSAKSDSSYELFSQ